MNAQQNAPISDRFSSLCARVFSPAAAILESEKTLGTRLVDKQHPSLLENRFLQPVALHSNNYPRSIFKMADTKKSRSAIRIKSSERKRSASKRDSATTRNKNQSVSNLPFSNFTFKVVRKYRKNVYFVFKFQFKYFCYIFHDFFESMSLSLFVPLCIVQINNKSYEGISLNP